MSGPFDRSLRGPILRQKSKACGTDIYGVFPVSMQNACLVAGEDCSRGLIPYVGPGLLSVLENTVEIN